MVDRFHKAAQDGYLDVLKEATKRDCNSKDEDGMTPTLWAAFEGNLDALRLLVARGGDPEKCDNYGNTALHLSSAKGHMNCVTYLVNFGISIWDLDIDLHSAKDLAAINDREDILKFLDSAAATQTASNPKQTKSQQEKAKKEAEKRIKNFQKIQKEAEKLASRDEKRLEKDRRKMSLVTGSGRLGEPQPQEAPRRPSLTAALMGTVGRRDSKLLAQQAGGTVRYSDMVGGTVNSKKMMGGVFKKIAAKNSQLATQSDFIVRDTTGDGTRTVRSVGGLRRDSEIMFGKKEVNDNDNDFEDDYTDKPAFIQEPSSIFNRPGFGSVTFRNSITAFNHLTISEQADEERKEDSIGSAGSLAHRNDRKDRMEELSEEDSDLTDDDDTGIEFTSLQMFLAANGLADWIPTFLKEKIDLDALMLLTESDLVDVLGMPLGPRKKLLKGINERKEAISDPDIIDDSRL